MYTYTRQGLGAVEAAKRRRADTNYTARVGGVASWTNGRRCNQVGGQGEALRKDSAPRAPPRQGKRENRSSGYVPLYGFQAVPRRCARRVAGCNR